MKKTYLLSMAFLGSALLLGGCHTTAPIDLNKSYSVSDGHDSLKYGQSKQPTNFDSDGNPRPWRPKTIAVTDISYSAEFREAFYFEENKVKKSDSSSDVKSESAVPQVIIPDSSSSPQTQDSTTLEKPTSIRRQDRRFDDKRVDKQTDMQAVGFVAVQAKEDELQSPPPLPAAPFIPPPASAQEKFQSQQDKVPDNSTKTQTIKSSNFEQTYTKKYGTERKINYGEIRGLSGPIKGMLLKAGYRVAQGRPNVERPEQNDDYFDIIKRIKSGDFEGADYVLYGVLTGLSISDNAAPITGTQNSMAINTLDIGVDFSLIDTKTMQVVASFLATGSGSDNRIDGKTEGFKPNFSKMMKQVSLSLSENVAYQLGAQEFIKGDSSDAQPPPRVIPGTEKYRNDETNLRVYK
jgi:hypothetical protein